MKKILVFVFTIILVFVMSCNNRSQKTTNPKNDAMQTKIDSMTKNAAKIKSDYMQELKAMNNEQLARQLNKESDRGLEPFNSLAYAEAIKRGPKFAENLIQLISDTTKTSLLGLLALDSIDVNSYNKVNPALRTAILLDALKNLKLYNAFGLPHIRIEFAGKAIIMEGKNIRNKLIGLLNDTKPAPVWGSEDYTEYLNYKYRVCDYALFFLKKIDGDEKFTMPLTSDERDSIIKTILKD